MGNKPARRLPGYIGVGRRGRGLGLALSGQEQEQEQKQKQKQKQEYLGGKEGRREGRVPYAAPVVEVRGVWPGPSR